MNKTNKNMRLLLVTIITTIIVFITLIPGKIYAAEPSVISVSHQPSSVSFGTNVTVTIAFDNDENISSVKILYCALEPEYLCHVPQKDMISTGINTWQGSFEVLENEGIIGYQVHVTHTEGNFIAPNSSNYLGHDNIAEPYTDSFYFTIELSTPTGNTPLNVGVPGILIAYFVYTIIRKRTIK